MSKCVDKTCRHNHAAGLVSGCKLLKNTEDCNGPYVDKTTDPMPSAVLNCSMPIMLDHGKKHDVKIPFSMLNEEWADRNHSQTLKCLARRGGLGPCEALAIMDKRRWRRMDAKAAIDTLIKRIDDMKA